MGEACGTGSGSNNVGAALLSLSSVGVQTMNRDRRGGGRTAFTLIELLVVMGIIAILAAMLMPALQRAREAAKRTSCLNNLKQMASGLAMYRKDHGQVPPGDNLTFGIYCWGSNLRDSWETLYPGYISSANLYLCPSEDVGDSVTKTTDLNPEYGQTMGGKFDGTQFQGWYVPTSGAGGRSRYHHVCEYYGFDPEKPTPSSCCARNLCGSLDRERACQRAGIYNADDVSYVYIGGASASQVDKRKSAEYRIAADHEQELPERIPGFWRYALRNAVYNPFGLFPEGLQNRSSGETVTRTRWNNPGPPIPDYYYVGGLDQSDNHGQDGVNVMYYDWHAQFDARSWPSPIGMQEADDWLRLKWTTLNADTNTLAGWSYEAQTQ